MPTKVVVGVQWGDEGKGKIIDILASRADVVIRSQGGNNAGHTVESGGEVYKLRLVPSGILYPHATCLIGCGTVIDPKSLLEELDGLIERGIDCGNLRIDPRAHVVMPWHLTLDALSEDSKGAQDIGTTRRGIGPCYADKADRIGLRMYDLTHPEELGKKARVTGAIKNRMITGMYGHSPLDIEAIIEEYIAYGQRLLPYMADVSVLAFEAIKANKEVLFEGAQGTLLDLDVGTYPFVTSSNPSSGGVCTGVGIGPTMIDRVIGVAKAYTTRVGKGPFPTELFDEVGENIRKVGNEFGTNTGRPRRIGWFDAVILRHAVRVNGLTDLAVNKLDTLQGIKILRICTGYKLPDGRLIKEFPPTFEELGQCQPVYEDIAGFDEDISRCRSFDELPLNCKAYIAKLEDVCGCPITMVGVGPAREQNLERTSK
ncbi:adenylosuccinate synthase [Oscillospiraceae bacterium MB08-C2-2]|nr:adenylosuccinate synthase [Oscillospiraceae bacterium MB08-C2-2]